MPLLLLHGRASCQLPFADAVVTLATVATICCAKTSSGFLTTVSLSNCALAYGANRRDRLQQIVAGQRIEDAFGNRAEPMARAADPLQQDRQISRRADMADHVDVADVDAELQRRRGDHDRKFAGLEFFFDFEASLARQAAVMRADFALAQPLGQLVRHALDQTARVDEDQRRAVRSESARRAYRRPRPRYPGG